MLHFFIILFSILGISLCLKIAHKKRQPKPLVCPLGADCNTVLRSDFSTFYGINLESIGVFYYGFIASTYLLLNIFQTLQTPIAYFILFGASLTGFLFSLYLIFVQAVLIKSWCSWCLTSAGLTILIFLCSMFNIVEQEISFIPILEFLKHPLLLIHLIGFALGVGGATINDILFFRFLKDYRISPKEETTLKIMSETIWIGLVMLIISGFGLYLPNAEALNESSKFLVKAIVVGIITVNGAFLNLYVAPHLKKIIFKDSHTKTTQISPLCKIAFVSGAISFTSWYTAFFLGTVSSLPFSFFELFGIYLILILVSIMLSLYIEKIYCTHTLSTNDE